ncbi:heavy metal translocating P-type ATPase [Pradoshia eiseniae]|uniref:Heavy metal translocating P-type ATPase n=1 Tax=Pradoshia eiseniae TaxID=2064768 RepID=A0A2S7MWG4_9BACI|nr:heavy metal translocating P-type ATPase [Pradoshia eiseniae]PQD94078.1 heavy metal translocating P-type ATPase [Pradoshia eiseniae]
METVINSSTQTSQKKPTKWKELSDNFSSFWELIAAGISGLLILLGWLLSNQDLAAMSAITYILAYIIGGYAKAKEGIIQTIEEKKLNVELLMILAAVGSAIIGYWTEGAILIFIFSLSGALETYTMNKSHKEISSLMNLQPEEALRIIDDKEEVVSVGDLAVGDLILIKPGERVPSDGIIQFGETSIDEAAITGESIPVSKKAGLEVFAGTVNATGTIKVEVTKPNSETLFQKIITLVQNAQSEKSPSQLFIERFEDTYVKSVLVIVAVMMFLPHYVLGWSWTETFYRAMVLLVVASPCALVASVMPATLAAISNGARNGILFKGGAHLEQLGHIKAIAFDKTGTLTQGKPVVTDIITRSDVDQKEFMLRVASIEQNSNHPLAQSIVQYVNDTYQETLPRIASEEVSGYGVAAIIEGTHYKIGKKDFVGRNAANAFHNGIADVLAEDGKTLSFVQDDHGIAGIIALKDIVRNETKDALEALKDQGIYTCMLTGDNERTAHAIAKESHLAGYVAECLPERKVEEIKKLRKEYAAVAMVGDGINDAPALASASVGIAMGEGTDVALETADIVLMKNDLPKIAEAIKLSKKMNRIIRQNVIFSITVIMVLICSNFFQILDLPFGVIGHEGSTILVILNGLRLLKS